MITFETTITFSAGAAIGALAMKIIDHRLAKSRTKEDRKIKGFNEAATRFRNTIINELTGLYPLPIDWPRNIGNHLNASLPKIQAAVEEFKHFIPSDDFKTFSKAWNQYYAHCKYTIPKAFSSGSIIYEIEKSQKAREDFKHNVDNLLSFAKEK